MVRVRAMRDEDIDLSDLPEVPEASLRKARPITEMDLEAMAGPRPKTKVSLSVRFDSDVVDFFKSVGPGYQTRMNAVLRMFMESPRNKRRAARNR